MSALPRLRVALSGVAALLASGCTYTAAGTSPGSLVITRPGVVPSPPATAAVAPVPPQPPVPPSPRDGPYFGTGRLIADPGLRGSCRQTIAVADFVVSGDRVRFGGFRGTIGPNGRLDMQSGHRFLSGQFTGEQFDGRVWQPQPSCTYQLRLTPVP